MAKKKRTITDGFKGSEKVVPSNNIKSTKRDQILTPTGDDFVGAHRLLPKIRYGKMSAEVFCKNPERRRELGLPIIRTDPLLDES